MMDPAEPTLEGLLKRAIHRVKAVEATPAIAQMRLQEASERPARSYEVVLPASQPVDYLISNVMPRLVYFLESAGFKLPSCKGAFLSVFYSEDLFFIRAADAIDELSRISALSPAQMVERFAG